MKKSRYKIFSLGIILFLCNSCFLNSDDLFNSEERSGSVQNEEAVYNDPTKAEGLLYQLYSFIPQVIPSRFNGEFSSFCDEAISSTSIAFNVGGWSPNSLPEIGDPWSVSYKAIRTINKFMENIQKMPSGDQAGLTEIRKRFMYQEAKCLRAYYYADLIRMFGGVPLITQSVVDVNQIVDTPKREKYAFMVDWVVNELDSVAPKLPTSWGGSEFGRVTRGTALATKARLLLYAASPLFNSAGADNSGNEYVCYGNTDLKRWERALIASNDIIKTGVYSLHRGVSTNSSRSIWSDAFFADRSISREAIFSYQKKLGGTWNNMYLPLTMRTNAGWPSNFPSYNVHAAFEMKSGKMPTSGLTDNGDGTYTEVVNAGSAYDVANPYKDRDPRYYDAILFNQAVYRNFTANIYIPFPGDEIVGSGKENETFGPRTGFYTRKWVNPAINVSGATQTGFEDFPIYRYAEVLLNYAEAMNEYYGPEIKPAGFSMTARDAVNEIRKRVVSKVIGAEKYRPTLASGMPLITTGLTQSEMRDHIRQERRVELIFESHRFFDVRRWMIAPQTERNFYYYQIQKKKDNTFVYTVKKFHTRSFIEPKMYLLPIPFQETQTNPNCSQNPGW